jgi:hypothetical protein
MQLIIYFLYYHYLFRLHAANFRWLFQPPPEDGCMKPKHVVEEEEENK